MQAENYDIRDCDIRIVEQGPGVTSNDLRARLKAAGIKQVHVANRLGIAANKISLALSGDRRFTIEEMDVIRAMLSEAEGEHLAAGLRAIPIIGQVAAGNWREAIKHPLASLPQPDPTIPARAFALRVSGDSMDLLVDDGAVVVVDPDDRDLYPGRFYVVTNGEGEATFKRFDSDPARLMPCSSNDAHQPIVIGSGEQFEILGRVIWRASRM